MHTDNHRESVCFRRYCHCAQAGGVAQWFRYVSYFPCSTICVINMFSCGVFLGCIYFQSIHVRLRPWFIRSTVFEVFWLFSEKQVRRRMFCFYLPFTLSLCLHVTLLHNLQLKFFCSVYSMENDNFMIMDNWVISMLYLYFVLCDMYYVCTWSSVVWSYNHFSSYCYMMCCFVFSCLFSVPNLITNSWICLV